MHCNKHPYEIGQTITMYVPNSTCMTCGFSNMSFQFVGTFKGHIYDGAQKAVFALITPIYCPSCGTKVTTYHDLCGEGYSLTIEQTEEVENPNQTLI